MSEHQVSEHEQNLSAEAHTGQRLPAEVEREILRALAKIAYGSIEVVIHDGKVVQIECREKIRVAGIDAGRKGAIRQIR